LLPNNRFLCIAEIQSFIVQANGYDRKLALFPVPASHSPLGKDGE
jgi:hypothetical protein